jgi:hypothetical protein
MTRTNMGLLSLCAMLFGLMAFGTSGAQAEVGAKWLILTSGGVLKTGAELHAKVNLEIDSPVLILHSEILHIKTLFLCTEVKVDEAKLLKDGTIGKEEGVPSGSKVLFAGCTTDLNGSPAAECTPEDPTAGVGRISTQPVHALLVLHELTGGVRDDLIEVIPDTGLGTTYVVMHLPAACPIGTSVPVIGKLFLKDCENKALEHLIKHLVEEGPLSELFTISKTAEHATKLLGSAWAFLEGEHLGLKWSGDPV